MFWCFYTSYVDSDTWYSLLWCWNLSFDVKVSTCFDAIPLNLMTVGPGRLSVDYWEDVRIKFSIVSKLQFEIWLLYYLLCRFWVLVISTQNHRDIMSNMLYYLVYLVGKLFRVRGVRDSRVPVFTFGVYVEKTGMFLLGDISYVPWSMPHNSLLHVTLHVLYFLLYILVRGYIYPPCPITLSARSWTRTGSAHHTRGIPTR